MTPEEFKSMLKGRVKSYNALAKQTIDKELKNIYKAIAGTYEVILAEYKNVIPTTYAGTSKQVKPEHQ